MESDMFVCIRQSHLDAAQSRRILELAKAQQEEEAEQDQRGEDLEATSFAGPSRLPTEMREVDEEEQSDEEIYEDEEFGDEEYEEIVSHIFDSHINPR
jgi:hypothetical protein